MSSPDTRPFLRVPPFPGAKVRHFAPAAGPRQPLGDAELDGCLDLIRRLRVGGDYWGKQPKLPERYVLLRSGLSAPAECRGQQELRWQPEEEFDPWHMLSSASALVCEADDELRAIAAILGVPAYVTGPDGLPELQASDAPPLLLGLLPHAPLENPFTGEPMGLAETIELCGFWRNLIDLNRGIAAGVGFAFWKQPTVEPLLWSGAGRFPFLRAAPNDGLDGVVAVWRAKTPADILDRLDRLGVPPVEVEDGFLRSQGLGADCVPPLSITADRLGAYFDPAQPSELELILEQAEMDEATLARARRLRETIVAAGLGKYERGHVSLARPGGARRHILVTGQVEDDRAVLTGGAGLVSNLELLKLVWSKEPDAFILYKPHPDVLAGHRKGDIPEEVCLRYADRIVADLPIASLIAMVDEVHVNTSLAGFEALMRGKPVTTYGVPFYAGWGLTRDRGPVPERRTRRRSLAELVAATLLLYPRYLDPVTGLPCPAEIVVSRLCADVKTDNGLLVTMRRLQGRLKRRLRSLVR